MTAGLTPVGAVSSGRADGSRRPGETLPAYMYRHAHAWAVTVAHVPADLAAGYAAWCRDAVTRDPSAFDYWNHRVEWPAWLATDPAGHEGNER